MRLALIVPGGFAPDGRREAIPALASLVAELAGRHDVHVFAFAETADVGRHALHGAQIHRVAYPWLADGSGFVRRGAALARLGAQVTRELLLASSGAPFDCIHAFWASEPGLLAGLLGRPLRIPVVLSVGGGEAVRLPELGYGGFCTRSGRAMGRLSFRLADEITVGTEFARALLPAQTAQRVRVVPLGVAWRALDAPVARAPGPPWRLLHVASLNAVKDQGTLMRAFAQVVARRGDVLLDCVGEDTLGGAVQAQAEALGIARKVRFHGFLPHAELVPMYRSAHLHVVSSRYESQGVAILEAAAAGVPTVGTAVGLVPALAPGAASSVAPGDFAALSGAIERLLAHEPERVAMGARAQAFARDHDTAWTARSFEEIYGRVLASGRRSWQRSRGGLSEARGDPRAGL